MENKKSQLKNIYETLLKSYGHQGWWPLIDCKGTNPTKTGSIDGYHPKDYSYPKTENQKFEICVGAILTQNTSWAQTEKALLNLNQSNALKPKAIASTKFEKLSLLIKPSGYFNQKARKLKEFTKFYIGLGENIPSREELLKIWGIGNETADSILLYAFKVPTFVVDSYTRRIFSSLGFVDEKSDYEYIKKLFEKNISPNLEIYQEYHALIVEHAKRCY